MGNSINSSSMTPFNFPLDAYESELPAQYNFMSGFNGLVPPAPSIIPGLDTSVPNMPGIEGFKGTPNWFDSLKGWGGKAVNNFMPKINANTGKMESLGWGMPALQGLSSLGNLYLGMKNYGLAKDQLRTQKDQFNRNYENQKQLLNTRMEDIQRTEAGGSSKAESVESYMARNRIK